MIPLTDYESLEQRDDSKQLLRQEELLVDAQEEIAIAMSREHVSKAELAKRLGRSRPFVTQILNSGRNLTLRTWADIATALGHRVIPRMIKDVPAAARSTTAHAVSTVEIVGSSISIPPKPQVREIDL